MEFEQLKQVWQQEIQALDNNNSAVTRMNELQSQYKSLHHKLYKLERFGLFAAVIAVPLLIFFALDAGSPVIQAALFVGALIGVGNALLMTMVFRSHQGAPASYYEQVKRQKKQLMRFVWLIHRGWVVTLVPAILVNVVIIGTAVSKGWIHSGNIAIVVAVYIGTIIVATWQLRRELKLAGASKVLAGDLNQQLDELKSWE